VHDHGVTCRTGSRESRAPDGRTDASSLLVAHRARPTCDRGDVRQHQGVPLPRGRALQVGPSTARSTTLARRQCEHSPQGGPAWSSARGVDLRSDALREWLRVANVRQLERAPQRLADFGRLACTPQRSPERSERFRVLEARWRVLEPGACLLELLCPSPPRSPPRVSSDPGVRSPRQSQVSVQVDLVDQSALEELSADVGGAKRSRLLLARPSLRQRRLGSVPPRKRATASQQ
jgi:hypothetical protein